MILKRPHSKNNVFLDTQYYITLLHLLLTHTHTKQDKQMVQLVLFTLNGISLILLSETPRQTTLGVLA